MNDFVREESCKHCVKKYLFLKEHSTIAVGGRLKRGSVFDATVLFIFPQGKMSSDTGEMKEEKLKPLLHIVNLT